MSDLTSVKIEDLKPNPYNPRKTFEEDALKELAKSISELGLLQPLVVYPDNGHFVVLCGDRRRQACEKAGLNEAPCRVIDPPRDKAHAVEIALTENLQRADLSTAEEAVAIRELVDADVKRSAIAKAIGKSPDYVSKRYALAIHPEVLEAFIANGEREINTWALLGKVEDKKLLKRILQTLTQYVNTHSIQFEIESVLKLQDFDNPKSRQVSAFCAEYGNKKQKVSPCCSGHGSDRQKCKHYAEYSYRVKNWLGLKGDQWSRVCVCTNTDQTCLRFKQEAEKTISEKLKTINSKRLLKQEYVYVENGYETVKMEDLGDKRCTKCKERVIVPEGFRGSRKLRHPYRYCTAKDSACFDAKVKALKEVEEEARVQRAKQNGEDYMTEKAAQAMSDEDLQSHLVKAEVETLMDNLEYSTAAEELMNRGFYAIPSLSLEWVKFEPPAECNAECICHEDHEHEFEYGYECFESCPHLKKEE